MEIPFSRWYDVIWVRRSRRQFVPIPLDSDALEGINKVCTLFRPFTGARAVLIPNSADKVFKGIVANYGKIKGAPAFVAFIGDMEDNNIHEKVGYTGEGIVLEAAALNIGTCWVGVSFKPKHVSSLINIKKNEKILAITPIGYTRERWSLEEKIMTGFGKTHKRKSMAKLIIGEKDTPLPLWIKIALESARAAPSAANRQPWRFSIKQDSITISVDNLKDTLNISKRLDCGIAMLHIEVALLQCGLRGKWEFLDPPEVASLQLTKEIKVL